MQKTNPIVVAGMGVASPVGMSLTDFWESVLSGQSAIQEWEDLQALNFKYSHACRIEDFHCDPFRRGYHLAKHAVTNAIEMVEFDRDSKIGLFVGTTMGESGAFEAFAEGELTDYPRDFTGDSICRKLKEDFPWIKQSQCFATGCAAGNYAIHGALIALTAGQVDVAIVGGVDPFSKIAMTGFSRSRAMSPSGICRPFSAERDGMILGEGAGFIVLQRSTDAMKNNNKIYAQVAGTALTCDAFHPTAPKPDASGIIHCLQQLFSLTNTEPNAIDWICSHGTGTKLSDASESTAIANVFDGKVPVVSSMKATMGHTLGAATALEAIVSVLSIHHQLIPPTANTKQSDFNVNIATKPLAMEVKEVINCGYAFGGLNSVSQFSRWN